MKFNGKNCFEVKIVKSWSSPVCKIKILKFCGNLAILNHRANTFAWHQDRSKADKECHFDLCVIVSVCKSFCFESFCVQKLFFGLMKASTHLAMACMIAREMCTKDIDWAVHFRTQIRQEFRSTNAQFLTSYARATGPQGRQAASFILVQNELCLTDHQSGINQ